MANPRLLIIQCKQTINESMADNDIGNSDDVVAGPIRVG
jgi:hypothetical protein